MPLLSRDAIKEVLFDELGWSDRTWSRRLGRASFALLFHLLERQLAAGRPAVVDANFRAPEAEPRFRALPPFACVQVVCTAPRDVLLARFAARRRHPGHVDDAALAEVAAAIDCGHHGPLALGGELVELDTGRFERETPGHIARVPVRGDSFHPPLLVVVTGPPASGKSRVARELARRLRIPFISKDELKERLYEVFGSGDELEAQIETAALGIVFSVVASELAAGVSVAAESNFDTRSDTAPFHRLCREHDLRLVQIHCSKAPEEVEATFAERAASGRRHPGHEDAPEKAPDVRADAEAGRWDALDIPGELLEVEIDELDYEELVGRIRALAG